MSADFPESELRQLKVRNSDGEMVPLGSVAEVQDSAGPIQITRYNMFPAAAINGAYLPGASTGDVLATMEELAKELPPEMTTEWTELSYLQKQESRLESSGSSSHYGAYQLSCILYSQ